MTENPDFPAPSPATDEAPSARPRWPWLVAAVLLGLIGAGVWMGFGTADPETGPVSTTSIVREPAPDFTIRLIGGDQFALSEHLATDGRPVFLNFWASWCIPCRNEMPAIDAAAAAHPEVLFLGIATLDDPEAAAAFAAEIGVTYAIGFDESEIKDELYPSIGLPATHLIAADGSIVERRLGEIDAGWIESAIATLTD